MTTPPIVPGPSPDEPIPYVPPPQQQYAPLQAPGDANVVRKTAIGTVTVIVTLVAVFCGLPVLMCGGMALFGAVLPGR
jgi:hypothetical protein